MENLSQALSQLYSPTTTNEGRKEVERNLELWKRDNNAINSILEYFKGGARVRL